MVQPDAVLRPAVTVIVPARNEEACLGACLESLAGQTGISFEVIVVDDGSTDRTRAIAESFPAVKVIEAPPLPANWIGKNSALAAGAKCALGKWLLFTDADTVHLPGSLARSVAGAEARGIALLSYSPEQEVVGFWEKAILPVIFAELATTYRPSEVSDPASPAAAANGQYVLITREAYEAIGGHAAVADKLLEDVELAKLVKSSGRKIFFRLGTGLVRTRMYRSFDQLREGWTKNLALLFPSPAELAVKRFAEFAVIVASAGVAVGTGLKGRTMLATIAGVTTAGFYVVLVRRIRRAHFSLGANMLALAGLPLFSYLLLRSWIFYKRGKVSWKGREYHPVRPGGTDHQTLKYQKTNSRDGNALSHAKS